MNSLHSLTHSLMHLDKMTRGYNTSQQNNNGKLNWHKGKGKKCSLHCQTQFSVNSSSSLKLKLKPKRTVTWWRCLSLSLSHRSCFTIFKKCGEDNLKVKLTLSLKTVFPTLSLTNTTFWRVKNVKHEIESVMHWWAEHSWLTLLTLVLKKKLTNNKLD